MLLFTDDHLFWYVARAAGLGAYLVLFIDVILGLMVRTKVGDRLVARWQSFDLHQFTSFVAIGLLALHVVALLGDHYIGYTVPQVLIPFTSPYRPVETAFGVIGMYLIVVTTASFWLKRFIGQRGWRTLHYATFSAFFLSLLHGLTAGTDNNQGWVWAMYWATGWAVTVLTIWRFAMHRPSTLNRAASVQQGVEGVRAH